jgi:hypothetical protein
MASTITAGNATNGLALSCDNTGILELKTGTGSGTTAVTIGTGQEVAVTLGSAAAPSITFSGDTNTGIFSPAADTIAFAEGGVESGRFDSGGNLLVGTTDAGLTTGVGFKFNPSATVPTSGVVVNSAVGNSSHIHLFNTNATNNGYRFYVVSDGGIYNFSGNNSNLSDVRTKTNIQLAGGYLAKVCAIPVKLFNYKDEAEGEQRTLGVIAQDVEAVAPELVNNDGFGETPEGEEPLKSIYTTDMMYALMKCIQEQQAMIEELKAKVAALEAK